MRLEPLLLLLLFWLVVGHVEVAWGLVLKLEEIVVDDRRQSSLVDVDGCGGG